jgi:hypothetical protein
MSQPTCETPGCGKSIPIGGEGCPEICPDCIEREKHDDLEKAFWGPACANTFGEELKQLKYMELMGFQRTPTWRTQYSFDMGGRSVIDIGGGPCSVLLKCENLGKNSYVVDPGEWPFWVRARYELAGIQLFCELGESFMQTASLDGFDLALIYNCLQHSEEPERVIDNARAVAKTLCMFEWIDIPPHPGHPHELKADLLNKWAGREGRIVELNGVNECTGRAWVLGVPPEPTAAGARRSRIVLGGAP